MTHINSKLFKLFVILVAIFGVSACGATANPEKRKPLEILPMKTRLPSSSDRILVRFEDTLLGKPIQETVWDNVTGAFWDIKESRQIGFTQDYSKLVSLAVAGGVVGGAIGGAVIGLAGGPQVVDTRIVIPFGRIFSEVMQSGLKNSFPNTAICSDDTCESVTVQSSQPKYVLKIQITIFQVWEGPLNHINLNASITTKAFRPDQMNVAELTFVTQKKLAAQSVGSVMSTSSGFISEMNRICNEFAGSLSDEVIDEAQRRF